MDDIENTHNSCEDSIYEVFPFLSHFPFEDYIIYYSKENFGSTISINSNEEDPISPALVNFIYKSNYITIVISFYKEDIDYIHEYSNKIKKFDDIRKKIDVAIKSDDILEKIKSIKKGEKLIKQIDTNISAGIIFDKILEEMLSSSNIKLNSVILKKIKTMSKSIVRENLKTKTKEIINIFYDMHLNHVKILIGIIIASKLS